MIGNLVFKPKRFYTYTIVDEHLYLYQYSAFSIDFIDISVVRWNFKFYVY